MILRLEGRESGGVLPDGTEFAKQIEQLLWSDVVAISSQYALHFAVPSSSPSPDCFESIDEP
jgi:hypothetical protein